jgi:hypothetical protein
VQLFLDYGLAAPRFLSTPFPLSLAVQRCDVRIVQVLLNAHIKVDYDVYLGVVCTNTKLCTNPSLRCANICSTLRYLSLAR